MTETTFYIHKHIYKIKISWRETQPAMFCSFDEKNSYSSHLFHCSILILRNCSFVFLHSSFTQGVLLLSTRWQWMKESQEDFCSVKNRNEKKITVLSNLCFAVKTVMMAFKTKDLIVFSIIFSPKEWKISHVHCVLRHYCH